MTKELKPAVSKDPLKERSLREIQILASLIADYSRDTNATFYANRILNIFKAAKILPTDGK
jgi:hypothetical protein